MPSPTSTPSDYGLTLPSGVQIIHGTGAHSKSAFPPDLNIPGTLHEFSPGHTLSPTTTPPFRGPHGIIEFSVATRMPRHVHLTRPEHGPQRFVTEKIFIPYGVGLVELSGEVYVLPPRTMVVIAPGVPHAWTACPVGLDVTKVLGLEGEEAVVSDGKCMAVYEYDEPTGFYPTKQTEKLCDVGEYVECGNLQDLRISEMGIEEVVEKAWFVWGREIRKVSKTVG